MKISSIAEDNYVFEGEWDHLIGKHKIRSDIWAVLELHNELNVTQITHYLEQGKTTVARHLKLMENDGVRAYVGRHAPELLEQFELVLNTVSMEEAVEQPEREDLQDTDEESRAGLDGDSQNEQHGPSQNQHD